MSQDATQRIPPRFWWLKRVGVAYVLFIAAIGGLRWWAGAVAERRLAADIEKLRGRGEMITLADFQEENVAEEENAAAHLLRAAAMLEDVTEEERAEFDDLPGKLPMTGAQMQLAQKVLGRYSKAMEEVRAARGKRGVSWGLKLGSPAHAVPLPWLPEQRELSSLLYAAALDAHQRGDDAAAIEYVRDMLMIGRAVDRSPFLVCHLVAIGISAGACDAAEQIAQGLRIAGMGGEGPAGAKPASREQVRKLVADLLDEAGVARGVEYSMQGERFFQLDTVRWLARGGINLNVLFDPMRRWPHGSSMSRLLGSAMHPLLMMEGRKMMRLTSDVVEAARQEDLVTASARMPVMPWAAGAWNRFRWPMTSLLVPAPGAVTNRHYQMLYNRRQVAIELAAREYQLEHGQRPARLADLVPKYLPAIPKDPVSGGALPMPFVAATQPTTLPAGG